MLRGTSAWLLWGIVAMVSAGLPPKCRQPGVRKLIATTPNPNARNACSRVAAHTVQGDWHQVYNAADGSERRFIIVQEVFKSMFSAESYRQHMENLIRGLDVIIKNLHDDQSLQGILRKLSDKRNNYKGAHVKFYKELTSALMTVLPQVTDQFNKVSWQSCLNYVGDIMHSDANQVMADHHNSLPLCKVTMMPSDVESTSPLSEREVIDTTESPE